MTRTFYYPRVIKMERRLGARQTHYKCTDQYRKQSQRLAMYVHVIT